MRVSFFLREATRSLRRNAVPSFAAMASVLVTMLVLGVFIPMVQATTGAANEVRGKVLVDVFLKTSATDAAVERVRRLLTQDTSTSATSTYVSKAAGLRAREEAEPRGLRAAGLQPAARHVPRLARQARQRRQAARRARADAPSGERAVVDPAIDEVKNRRDETTKILSATRVVKLSMAFLGAAARPRLGPADLQHDPPVAFRAPPRGRGHEARRRDGLVHPLAVRHRGDHRRRDGRRAWRSPAARRRRSRSSIR